MLNHLDQDDGSFSQSVSKLLERLRHDHPLLDRIYYIYDLTQQQTLWGTGSVVNLLGYSPETIHQMGMTGLAELIHPDDVHRVSEHYQKFLSLRDSEVIEIEYRMLGAIGRWCSLYSQETPLVSEKMNAKPTQILGMIQALSPSSRYPPNRATQLTELLR